MHANELKRQEVNFFLNSQVHILFHVWHTTKVLYCDTRHLATPRKNIFLLMTGNTMAVLLCNSVCTVWVLLLCCSSCFRYFFICIFLFIIIIVSCLPKQLYTLEYHLQSIALWAPVWYQDTIPSQLTYSTLCIILFSRSQ